MSNSSKNLVIDACVGRSMGKEETTYSTAINCREFLLAIRDHGHCIVITPEIRQEWEKHCKSETILEWKAEMVSRGKILPINPKDYQEVWDAIATTADNEGHERNMAKDFRLLKAALETDKTIISLDEKSRRSFANASKKAQEIREIVWVNPDRIEKEQPIAWLNNGAEFESDRILASFRIQD
ncbi:MULTISPECIES: hypothetical protein [Spirulina sp. CCY15215]|uniref:hypothetical protein n=1 Tax=Spirulina sp. CCY15215 TaxID=2767591 RepID=UPI0019529E1F|nr:hypothetical protein [Spirulina major]